MTHRYRGTVFMLLATAGLVTAGSLHGCGCTDPLVGFPLPGAPCSADQDCPAGQGCALGACRSRCPCPSGSRCVGGHCYPEACGEVACVAPSVCLGDACGDPLCTDLSCGCGASCAEGEKCVRGRCLPANCPEMQCDPREACYEGACTPDYCIGVVCPRDEACAAGNCYPVDCDGAPCKAFEGCIEGRCQDLHCYGVVCPAGSSCAKGVCYPDGCDATPCAAGQVCYEGACTEPACVRVHCGEGRRCEAGICTQCLPDYYEAAGVCLPKEQLGGTCEIDEGCKSGFCVGGACCESACDQACRDCTGGSCGVAPAGRLDPKCGAYLCAAGGVCATTCTADGDCRPGASCLSGQCRAWAPNGSPCVLDNECASSHCSDGVCCDTACAGGCDVCNDSEEVGRCVVAPAGAAGQPGCQPYVCDGSASSCPTSCTSAAQCAAGTFCAGGACASKKANGQSCAAAEECQSSACADGVCCDSACAGPCDVCNKPGSLGSCAFADAGTAGSPSCTPYTCSGTSASCRTSCGSASECSPGSLCVNGTCIGKKANGGSCASAGECESGFCADGYCCDTACAGACDVCDKAGAFGTCSFASAGSPGAPSCSPYVCSGTAASCPSGCSSDAQCAATHFCGPGGVCLARKARGSGCASGNECASGNCVDAYCCDTACAGPCERCNHSAALGTCTVYSAGSSGDPSCSPYVCGGSSGACPITCASQAECAAGYFCGGGSCQPKKPDGSGCAAASECQSGFCADGYCCNTACAGACDVCDAAGSIGACAAAGLGSTGAPTCSPFRCDGASTACPTSCSTDGMCANGYYCSGGGCLAKEPNGSTCARGGECASGFCVDGYCCNSACTGGCDFCNLPTSQGTCTVAPDATAGANPSCSPYLCDGASASCPTSCGGDPDCVSGTCSGGLCSGKRANGAPCAGAADCVSNFCVDGYCCNSACAGACDVCNLAGSIGTCSPALYGTPGSPSCSPYRCNGTLTSCPTSCTGDGMCDTGYYCGGGTCRAKKSTGTTCAAANECQSGFCVDGYCCGSACAGGCDVCNAPGKRGTCSAVGAGSPGANPSCSPYLCDGAAGSCPTSCTSDASCASGHFCGGGTCQPKRTNGNTCTAANQCASGFCVDGYCCNSACTAGCYACNVAGSLGACAPELGASCNDGNACTYDDACNASGACVGTTLSCTSDACTTRSCNGTASCTVTLNNGAACNDGKACTANDVCSNGTCAGTVSCTPPANSCYQGAGSCDGSGNCTFAIAPSGTVCRPATQPCDIQETCDGSSGACPADVVRPQGYLCRASGGVCDVEDRCDGVNATCPDVKAPTTQTCRSSTGQCDPAEKCNGTSNTCPADVKYSAKTPITFTPNISGWAGKDDGSTNIGPGGQRVDVGCYHYQAPRHINRGAVSFNTSSLAGNIVTGATLRLYYGGGSGPQTVQLFKATSPYSDLVGSYNVSAQYLQNVTNPTRCNYLSIGSLQSYVNTTGNTQFVLRGSNETCALGENGFRRYASHTAPPSSFQADCPSSLQPPELVVNYCGP